MSESNTNPTPSPDITTLISNLFSSPEALSKINGILSKYSSSENSENSPPNDDLKHTTDKFDESNDDINKENESSSPTEQVYKNAENTFDFSKITSLFGDNFVSLKHFGKEQTNLLCAIRPYLSPRRQELIDSFIKFTQMSEVFKKISQSGGTNVLQ